MKFLLSTNSPDRKRTENIVDEINTALYNREESSTVNVAFFSGGVNFRGFWRIIAHRENQLPRKLKFSKDVREKD